MISIGQRSSIRAALLFFASVSSNVGLAAGTACDKKINELFWKNGGSFSKTANLTKAVGCGGQFICTVNNIVKSLNLETGVPGNAIRALLYTESTWRHWKTLLPLKPLVAPSKDWGIAQINQFWGTAVDRWPASWFTVFKLKKTVAWSSVQHDILTNARFGALYYRDSLKIAAKKYVGVDRLRAAYAIYNAGPAAGARPFTQNDPRDKNFHRNLIKTPWIANTTKECQ